MTVDVALTVPEPTALTVTWPDGTTQRMVAASVPAAWEALRDACAFRRLPFDTAVLRPRQERLCRR